MTWTRWHDSVPACAYSEEFCEAALSRLGKSCTSNPNMVTVLEMQHLYLLVRRTDTAPKDLPGGQVRGELVGRLQRHLEGFVTHGHAVVGYVPWAPGRTCVAQEHWPETFLFPGSLWAWPSGSHLEAVMRHALYRLTRSPVLDRPLRSALRDAFGRKHPAQRQRDEAVLQAKQPVVIPPSLSRQAHIGRVPSARLLRVGRRAEEEEAPRRPRRARPRPPRPSYRHPASLLVIQPPDPIHAPHPRLSHGAGESSGH